MVLFWCADEHDLTAGRCRGRVEVVKGAGGRFRRSASNVKTTMVTRIPPSFAVRAPSSIRSIGTTGPVEEDTILSWDRAFRKRETGAIRRTPRRRDPRNDHHRQSRSVVLQVDSVGRQKSSTLERSKRFGMRMIDTAACMRRHNNLLPSIACTKLYLPTRVFRRDARERTCTTTMTSNTKAARAIRESNCWHAISYKNV